MPKRKTPVEVDQAEVDRIVDLIRRHANFELMSNEQRAEEVSRPLLTYGPHTNAPYSKESWQNLAERVRRKLLWATPLDPEA